MPELPEVETTLRGITPWITNQKIRRIEVRHHGLRWPVPRDLDTLLAKQKILTIMRRGKYLLFVTAAGTLILHLGMSGSLRILKSYLRPGKHDHVDIEFANDIILRFTDPRRFGAILWTTDDPALHPLLKNLGPEPLEKNFTAKYLLQRAQKRNVPVKSFLMDSKIVVGVGNIYATEALFLAGICPQTAAGKISLARYQELVKAVKTVLRNAIRQGGTTLKDFSQSDGKPGYFSQSLKVYGRVGLPCVTCGKILKMMRIGQRSTVFCGGCQA